MFRLATRAVRPAARGFATSAAAGENEFVARRAAIRQHAAGEYTLAMSGMRKWDRGARRIGEDGSRNRWRVNRSRH